MRVILLRDIRGVGRKNEVKEVKDGYARNVLFPQKLVVVATDKAVQDLQSQIKKSQTEKEKFLLRLKSEAELLKGIVLEFPARANERGEIFGSVSAKDIEKALAKKGFIPHIRVCGGLEKPIKQIGEYQIEINLGEGIKIMTKIKVFAKP